MTFHSIRKSLGFRFLASGMTVCLACSPSASAPALAQVLLPQPGAMLLPSPVFKPALLKGVRINPGKPFLFDFIVDAGQSGLDLQSAEFKTSSEKLIKYFLASLALKGDDQWVNLSPVEKDRVTSPALGQTELGGDMLAQDYLLKQFTASLFYPESDFGKAFWDRVYATLGRDIDPAQIPLDSFNRVWIVADKADVLERNNTAMVMGGHLKVMLEKDYQAKAAGVTVSPEAETNADAVARQAIREVILPAIEKEVNEGKTFAPVRQIFYAMVLACWYKKVLKNALLNKIYSDKSKIAGVRTDDPGRVEKIYTRYLEAYTKGVFNYIKEDTANAAGDIPRKYFSGGMPPALDAGQATIVRRNVLPKDAEALGNNTTGIVSAGINPVTVSRHDAAQSIRVEQNGIIFDVSTYEHNTERMATAMIDLLMTATTAQKFATMILPSDRTSRPAYALFLQKLRREIEDTHSIEIKWMRIIHMDEYLFSSLPSLAEVDWETHLLSLRSNSLEFLVDGLKELGFNPETQSVYFKANVTDVDEELNRVASIIQRWSVDQGFAGMGPGAHYAFGEEKVVINEDFFKSRPEDQIGAIENNNEFWVRRSHFETDLELIVMGHHAQRYGESFPDRFKARLRERRQGNWPPDADDQLKEMIPAIRHQRMTIYVKDHLNPACQEVLARVKEKVEKTINDTIDVVLKEEGSDKKEIVRQVFLTLNTLVVNQEIGKPVGIPTSALTIGVQALLMSNNGLVVLFNGPGKAPALEVASTPGISRLNGVPVETSGSVVAEAIATKEYGSPVTFLVTPDTVAVRSYVAAVFKKFFEANDSVSFITPDETGFNVFLTGVTRDDIVANAPGIIKWLPLFTIEDVRVDAGKGVAFRLVRQNINIYANYFSPETHEALARYMVSGRMKIRTLGGQVFLTVNSADGKSSMTVRVSQAFSLTSLKYNDSELMYQEKEPDTLVRGSSLEVWRALPGRDKPKLGHGDDPEAPWVITGIDESGAEISLTARKKVSGRDEGEDVPFSYTVTLLYQFAPDGVIMSHQISNTSDTSLKFWSRYHTVFERQQNAILLLDGIAREGKVIEIGGWEAEDKNYAVTDNWRVVMNRPDAGLKLILSARMKATEASAQSLQLWGGGKRKPRPGQVIEQGTEMRWTAGIEPASGDTEVSPGESIRQGTYVIKVAPLTAGQEDASFAPAQDAAATGGIDFNGKNLQMNLAKQGRGVDMSDDAAMPAKPEQSNITGISLKILAVTPVSRLDEVMGLPGPLPASGYVNLMKE